MPLRGHRPTPPILRGRRPNRGRLYRGSGGKAPTGAAASGVTTVVAAIGDKSADRTTASATFVDFTDLSVSIAAAAGNKLYLRMSVQQISASAYIGLTFNVGTGGSAPTGDVAGTDALDIISAGGSGPRPVTIDWIHTVVAGDILAGNVTVKGRWLASVASANARNSTLGYPRLTVANFG